MTLLTDCVITYFNIRKVLIGPFLQQNVDEMNQNSILEYSKTGCAYMIQICEDEYKLFHEYFEIEHEELA